MNIDKKYSVYLEYYSESVYKHFDTYEEAMWFIVNEGDRLEDYEIFRNVEYVNAS